MARNRAKNAGVQGNPADGEIGLVAAKSHDRLSKFVADIVLVLLMRPRKILRGRLAGSDSLPATAIVSFTRCGFVSERVGDVRNSWSTISTVHCPEGAVQSSSLPWSGTGTAWPSASTAAALTASGCHRLVQRRAARHWNLLHDLQRLHAQVPRR